MKRIILSSLSVLLLAMTIVIPVFAGTEITRFEFPYKLEFDDVTDPCTGDTVDAEITGMFTIQEVSDSDSSNIITTYKLRGTLSMLDSETGEVVDDEGVVKKMSHRTRPGCRAVCVPPPGSTPGRGPSPSGCPCRFRRRARPPRSGSSP